MLQQLSSPIDESQLLILTQIFQMRPGPKRHLCAASYAFWGSTLQAARQATRAPADAPRICHFVKSCCCCKYFTAPGARGRLVRQFLRDIPMTSLCNSREGER